MSQDAILAAVLKSGVTLPPPSRSLLRLKAAADNPASGPRELAAIAATDPVLAGLLTRIANSPVFYQQGRARKLADIVALLGGTKTIAVAVGAALQGATTGLDRELVDTLWSRSVACAGWALRVAHVAGRQRLADLAFMTALIHDAGLCILLKRVPGAIPAFRQALSGEFDAAALGVDALTGSDHAAIGALVARNWKLPAAVAEAVRLHHKPAPDEAVDDDVLALSAIVAATRYLVSGDTAYWREFEPAVVAHLGLDRAALDALNPARAASTAAAR